MNRIKTASVALLLASCVGLNPSPAEAKDKDKRSPGSLRRPVGSRDDDGIAGKISATAVRIDGIAARMRAKATGMPRGTTGRRSPIPAATAGRNDRIYRGSDDRYYCKRDDGTVGLVLGGIAGGALGNIITPGGYKTLGTIVGAGAGALIGKAIDDGDIVCK